MKRPKIQGGRKSHDTEEKMVVYLPHGLEKQRTADFFINDRDLMFKHLYPYGHVGKEPAMSNNTIELNKKKLSVFTNRNKKTTYDKENTVYSARI